MRSLNKKRFKIKTNKNKLINTIPILIIIVLLNSIVLADDFVFLKEDENFELLGETIVTVNKIEENLKDIPQSITVIDSEILEEKEIKNITDVIDEIPNMNTSGKRGTLTSFRGLNASMFTSNNPIVIYVDGVPYYDRFDFDPSLDNVKQIEVLRGPQGTLYGKDAIGAVINIISKEPKNEWSGSVGAGFGSNNSIQTTFNTSGALIKDKLFLGINGSFDSDDGWITNDYPGMDENANASENRKTSAFLSFKPTDNFSGKLTVTDNSSEENFMNGFATDNSVSIDDVSRDDAENVSFDVPSIEKAKTKSQSLNLTYNMKNVKIESTTTHKNFDIDGEYDTDFKANQGYCDGLKQYNYTNTDTWTQEIKFSNNNKNIKWVTGIYLDAEERDQGPVGMEFPYVSSTYGYLGDYTMNGESVTKSYTQAIFGQVILPIGERAELTLGGRYQRINKEIDQEMYFHKVGVSADPTSEYDDEKTWYTFLPKVAFSYKYNKNLTAYTSVSKGYMPGGFNYLASSSSSKDNSFDSQTSTNYEAGIKYSNEKYVINASVFRMDMEDIHVYKSVDNSFVTGNAKKAHSQGIEIDGKYHLTERVELSGAIGLIDAKYDDYDAGTKTFDGEKVQNTPKYTANLGIAYIANEGIYGSLDIRVVGDISYYDSANNEMIETNGAIISNAKLGYKINDWDIYGYISNMTDESYICSYLSKKGTTLFEFNDPRFFGIGVKYRF